MSHQIHIGSNLDVLPTLPDNSVDAIVTDPPYELGFMGKAWDASGIAYNVNLWRECLRVLKPGGHLLAFSGSRTYHRMTCAIEDAGFEVRDQIMWVYGSGFPKSHNVSKAMVKQGQDAEQWDGWGTALKPAHEPICVARKPLEGTVVENVRKWGVGGLNIDGCRVEFVSEEDKQESIQKNQHADFGSTMGGNQVYGDYSMLKPQNYAPPGRWPANLIHDGSQEVLELFPGQVDASAGRFFYCPKASKSDRDDGCDAFEFKSRPTMGSGIGGQPDQQVKNNRNNHPTVKPTDLMAYLCRLVTPPGGTILDPFTGSGSTGRGAVSQGFNFIGIELSAEYAAIAEARIKAAIK